MTHEDKKGDHAFLADFTRKCIVCEAIPVVNATELCGPCTWGEAATLDGAWENSGVKDLDPWKPEEDYAIRDPADERIMHDRGDDLEDDDDFEDDDET